MNRVMIFDLDKVLTGSADQTRCTSDFLHGGEKMIFDISGIATAKKRHWIQFDRSYRALDIENINQLNDPMGRMNQKLGPNTQQASLRFKTWIEPGEFIQGKETIKTFT